MVKKCVYCTGQIPEDYVLDVCEKCGYEVWGAKMFKTIQQNMKDAHQKGDI